MKRAGGIGHVGHNERQNLFSYLPILGFVRRSGGVDINVRQLSIVVQHLFEVRHQPLAVGAVSMKASGQVVSNSASSHRIERVVEHTPGSCVVVLLSFVLQQCEFCWHRKLGRVGIVHLKIHAPEFRIVTLDDGKRDAFSQLARQLDFFEREAGEHLFLKILRDRFGTLLKTCSLCGPGLDDSFRECRKSRPAVDVCRREVCAARDGFSVGCQEHR